MSRLDDLRLLPITKWSSRAGETWRFSTFKRLIWELEVTEKSDNSILGGSAPIWNCVFHSFSSLCSYASAMKSGTGKVNVSLKYTMIDSVKRLLVS